MTLGNGKTFIGMYNLALDQRGADYRVRYFRKMETFVPHPDFPSVDLTAKGQTGPVRIGYFSDASEGSKLFIKSATNVGIPFNPDFNTSKGTLGVNKVGRSLAFRMVTLMCIRRSVRSKRKSPQSATEV
jgi:hypothetical protein